MGEPVGRDFPGGSVPGCLCMPASFLTSTWVPPEAAGITGPGSRCSSVIAFQCIPVPVRPAARCCFPVQRDAPAPPSLPQCPSRPSGCWSQCRGACRCGWLLLLLMVPRRTEEGIGDFFFSPSPSGTALSRPRDNPAFSPGLTRFFLPTWGDDQDHRAELLCSVCGSQGTVCRSQELCNPSY